MCFQFTQHFHVYTNSCLAALLLILTLSATSNLYIVVSQLSLKIIVLQKFCQHSVTRFDFSRPGNRTGIFVVRVLATGLQSNFDRSRQHTLLPVTPRITTYQDTAERSASTRWYNGNGRCIVMVGALVRILTAVVFLFFTFFLTKLKFLGKFQF